MIAAIAVGVIGLSIAAVCVSAATSRRHAMQRHGAPTFVFADLAGYTALTERCGDEAAASVAREFRRTMRSLMRGCDWYGSTVNIAARLAEEAEPNQALVSAATCAAARGQFAPRLAARRELTLRGVERPVAAWRLA